MTQQDSPYDRPSLLNAVVKRFSCAPRLTPGDVCEIDLRRAG